MYLSLRVKRETQIKRESESWGENGGSRAIWTL
jgi:hypothetical protein